MSPDGKDDVQVPRRPSVPAHFAFARQAEAGSGIGSRGGVDFEGLGDL